MSLVVQIHNEEPITVQRMTEYIRFLQNERIQKIDTRDQLHIEGAIPN